MKHFYRSKNTRKALKKKVIIEKKKYNFMHFIVNSINCTYSWHNFVLDQWKKKYSVYKVRTLYIVITLTQFFRKSTNPPNHTQLHTISEGRARALCVCLLNTPLDVITHVVLFKFKFSIGTRSTLKSAYIFLSPLVKHSQLRHW